MNNLLTCVDGDWSLISGSLSCSGTVFQTTTDDILIAHNFITYEGFAAYWPWALYILVLAFGYRMVKRTLYSKA